MRLQHWVIVSEWSVGYDSGHEVLGVYHNENDACEALKKLSDGERKFANDFGYEIYEDTPYCFDAGKDGEYATEHTFLTVTCVENNDRQL